MCALPGYVEEDQPLYVGQWDVLRVHLKVQLFVETPGVTDLLQAHLHIHSFVMEPVGREQEAWRADSKQRLLSSV